MLHLNKAIIPDPDAPVVLDAHGGEAGPELVVIAVDHIQYHDRTVVTCAFRGSIVDVRGDRLAAVLVSAGLRPLGRLERRERGVKPRPEGFDITGAVNDIGPRLRALREQTGLRIGELARALGCPLPNLSRVELGEWVPGAPGLAHGTFDVDRNAHLAAYLADALLRARDILPGSGAAAEVTLFAALNPGPCKACNGAGGWCNSMSDPGTPCSACKGTGVAAAPSPAAPSPAAPSPAAPPAVCHCAPHYDGCPLHPGTE